MWIAASLDQRLMPPGRVVHLGIQIGPKDRFLWTTGSSALLEETFR